MLSKELSFAVIGSGSWGTALAILLANNGHRTALWGRNTQYLSELARERVCKKYLPDIRLPESLQVTGDINAVLSAADIPLFAVPSNGFRTLLQQHADAIRHTGNLVWATKGLETDSQLLMSEVAAQVLGDGIKLAVITGPNFAGEVARGLPTATTVASSHPELAKTVAGHLHNRWFRAYTSTDITGAQLGGALKNVLAIASGISDGLGLGANSKAALLTRGLAEITRLAVNMGAKAETLTGLAGMGDMLLSCTDDQSRNRRLGLLLAQNKTLATALIEIGQVVEGVKTAQAAYHLSKARQVEMPIIEQVYKVLHDGTPPATAVETLLMREPKPEQL